jgi:hypothetical protein
MIGKKYNLEKKETRALGDGHQARVELGGAAFGAAFDNPGTGVALGMCIGIALGAAQDAMRVREKNNNPD